MLDEDTHGKVCVPLRIYIAGPLRKLDEHGHPFSEPDPESVERAAHAAREIFILGHIPLCPHTMTQDWFASTHEAFQDQRHIVNEFCLSWLRVSDALYMLPKWEKSRGSRTEWAFADDLGMPIYHSLAQIPEIKPDDGGRQDLMDARDDWSRVLRWRLILGDAKHGDNWKRDDCRREGINEITDCDNWLFLAAQRIEWDQKQRQEALDAMICPQAP